MKAEELAKEISNALNVFGFNYHKFNETMGREHRTLQYYFTQLCVEWLLYCGSDKYQFDERNETCHNIGLKMRKILGYD